jgi:hypothetical protein
LLESKAVILCFNISVNDAVDRLQKVLIYCVIGILESH